MKQLFLSVFVVKISDDISRPSSMRGWVEPRTSVSRVPSVVSLLRVTVVTREVVRNLGPFRRGTKL